jgi:hypothetical protein
VVIQARVAVLPRVEAVLPRAEALLPRVEALLPKVRAVPPRVGVAQADSLEPAATPEARVVSAPELRSSGVERRWRVDRHRAAS